MFRRSPSHHLSPPLTTSHHLSPPLTTSHLPPPTRSSPALIIATLSEMIISCKGPGAIVSGGVGSGPDGARHGAPPLPIRVSQLAALRFLYAYIMHTPHAALPSLAAGWPRLLALLRGALTNSVGGCTPPLLLTILWEWTRQLGPLGEAHPLSRPRERREASELCEQLVRATTSTVARASKRIAKQASDALGASPLDAPFSHLLPPSPTLSHLLSPSLTFIAKQASDALAASAHASAFSARVTFWADEPLPSLAPHSPAWEGIPANTNQPRPTNLALSAGRPRVLSSPHVCVTFVSCLCRAAQATKVGSSHCSPSKRASCPSSHGSTPTSPPSGPS